jgi:adenine phosphoribosyltransferase
VLARFKKSLEDAPIIKVGDYDYFVHPITDGVPRADPAILEEVVMAMLRLGKFDCDVILGPETLGVPLAVALSLELGIPYAIARKRCYGLPGEIRVDQATGYSKGAMFINDLKAGDRVVIVDDVISTGGTLGAIIAALRNAGIEIVDVLVAVEKGDAAQRIEQELGVRVHTMTKVEVRDGRLVVLN